MTRHERLTLVVGHLVYQQVLLARARALLQRIAMQRPGPAAGGPGDDAARRSARGGEDEVSEEIVVWGDADDGGGGGVDVLTLDPWMWTFTIAVIDLGPIPPFNPPPGGGNDTPPPSDPCAQLRLSIQSMQLSIAANETAIRAYDELIAEADSAEERKSLRRQKQQAKDSNRQMREAIAAAQAQMSALDC